MVLADPTYAGQDGGGGAYAVAIQHFDGPQRDILRHSVCLSAYNTALLKRTLSAADLVAKQV